MKQIKKISILLILMIPFFLGHLFAQNEDCNLLRGGTLLNGESTTGRSISEATYTQSCDDSRGILSCVDGVLQGQKNTYVEGNCTPRTWNRCTAGGNAFDHWEVERLYNRTVSTSTISCNESSKSLRCIDGQWGVATDGSDIGEYTEYQYTECNQQTYQDCINPPRTNAGFTTNNRTLIGYSANESTLEQSCNDFRTEFVCRDGDWYTTENDTEQSAENIEDFFLSCTATQFDDCTNPSRANAGSTIHNRTLIGYSANESTLEQSCNDFRTEFVCRDGDWYTTENGTEQSAENIEDFFLSCTAPQFDDCVWEEEGITVNHNQSIIVYEDDTPLTEGQTCEDLEQTMSCNNGTWLDEEGSPLDNDSINSYVPNCTMTCSNPFNDENTNTRYYNGDILKGWALQQSNTINICDDFYTILECSQGAWININNNGFWQGDLYSECNDLGTIKCTIKERNNMGDIVYNNYDDGETIDRYNTKVGYLFTDQFGREINDSCEKHMQTFSCNNGERTNSSGYSISTYRYSEGECVNQTTGTDLRRFDISLNRSVEPIQKKIDAATPGQGALAVKEFVIQKITKVLTPLIVVLGILVAILGFYNVMFVEGEESTAKGIRYIGRGVVGVIIVMSAQYLGNTLYSLLDKGNGGDIDGIILSEKLYDQVFFPFIKIAIYLVVGVLFIILAVRAFSFLGASGDETKKRAGTIIARNTIGILIILGAKQIVEAVYGSRSQVINEGAQSLGEIGSGVLANKDIPILYQVINRALGLAAFVVLILIIVQTVQLLTNPDNPDQLNKIKRSLFYIFLGVLVIGVGYIITNFFIIN